MTDDTIRDQHDHTHDESPAEGIKRRNVLACMAWAGTGLVWTFASGLLSSRTLGQAVAAQPAAGQSARGNFAFVQMSDTHIGFKGEANPDVIATLHRALVLALADDGVRKSLTELASTSSAIHRKMLRWRKPQACGPSPCWGLFRPLAACVERARSFCSEVCMSCLDYCETSMRGGNGRPVHAALAVA